ncbi:MAG: hypothetical protein K2X27_05090 [Candidatus Obscuribacterales bacterium]|nr:hypothetical protein [Candidatus Obscuribacterales bacterium]
MESAGAQNSSSEPQLKSELEPGAELDQSKIEYPPTLEHALALASPPNTESFDKAPEPALFKAESIAPVEGLLAERIDANGSSGGSFDQIDSISKQLLQKEIELLKLNTRYRIESTRVDKLKPWRVFGYSLAGNVLIEVGISHIAYARWKYWRRPSLATKAFLRKGPQCLLIGHAIIFTGAAIEAAIDTYRDHKQKVIGFDRKTCRNRVITLKSEIEQLLNLRDAALQSTPMSQSQTEVLKVEGKVLSDVKNCAVEEFSRLAVREAKIKTARNTATIMNMTQAATGGFVGSLGNLLAVSNRKPRLALPAGIGFAVSGGVIVATPPATKILSILAANAQKKKESKLLELKGPSSDIFDTDRQTLNNTLATLDSSQTLDGVKRRLEIYSMQNEIMDKQILMAKAEAKANNREFMEKLISNTIAGGTKISWGTNLIVAGSAFSNTAPKAAPTLPVRLGNKLYRVPIRPMKTPAQLFSRRVAQGATSNIAGPFVGAFDAIQSRARGEIRERKAKKNGNAAGQLLAARMKTLEEMEAKLK